MTIVEQTPQISTSHEGGAPFVPQPTVRSEIVLSDAINAGLDVEALKDQTDTIEQMVRHNVLPRTTWASALKSKNKALSPANSERVVRVIRIKAEVAGAFAPEHADEWLETPNSVFGDRPPIALLVNDAGARAIEIYLNKVKHGMTA